jgi:hypothetical protein
MVGWLTDILGEQNATYALYGLGALAALLIVWVLWFWTRRVSGGVFVAGGRGRQPRLAVVDAAAVDSHRRVVLIRRDNVEHLVMIGGHNDLVIERDIGKVLTEEPRPRQSDDRKTAEKPKPEPRPAAAAPAPTPRPEPQIRQVINPAAEPKPEPVHAPVASRPVVAAPAPTPAPEPVRPAEPQFTRRLEDVIPATSSPPDRREPSIDVEPDRDDAGPDMPTRTVSPAHSATREAEAADTDTVTTPSATRQIDHPRREGRDGSLEDEMEKLLSELSDHK